MTAYEKGKITGHFIAHWGVPKEIRPLDIGKIREFAILEFEPREPRRTWRYATNGMSSYLQPHPEKLVKVRTELYACTKERTRWIDELLAAMAVYPQDYATYFAEGDTINVGQPIDQMHSRYQAILLAPPGPVDPPTLGLVSGVSENILVHQIIGLLPSEIAFAEEYSGKELWERLLKKGEPALDEIRSPI